MSTGGGRARGAAVQEHRDTAVKQLEQSVKLLEEKPSLATQMPQVATEVPLLLAEIRLDEETPDQAIALADAAGDEAPGG